MGADESKPNNHSGKSMPYKEVRAHRDLPNKLPPMRFVENKHATLQPRPEAYSNQTIPDFIKQKPSENGSAGDKSRRSLDKRSPRQNDGKHRTAERTSRDRKPKQKDHTQNEHSSPRRKSPHKSKHRSEKAKSSKDNEKGFKSKKEKNNEERHHKRKERKGPDAGRHKSKTDIPSSPEKENVGKDKRSRKGKKKRELEKRNHNHRSAPDLTSSDTSKVGAWLNSAAQYWPPENPSWNSTYGFQYATLPGPYSQNLLDESGNPPQIVDGMGTPVGTILPGGGFLPDGTSSPSLQPNFSPPSTVRYSMPPMFPVAYPYQYFVAPQYYANYNAPVHERNEASRERKKFANRSRSENQIDLMDNDVILHGKVRRHQFQSKKKATRSVPPEGVTSTRESVSSAPSIHEPTQEFYSDIVQTRDSLSIGYKANQEIAVDNVKHADFTLNTGASPEVSASESSDSEQDSSSSDSSCNDVVFDNNDVKELEKVVNKSSNGKGDTSTVKVFQPVSKREVYIDDSPENKQSSTVLSTSSVDTQNQSGPKAPIMTLSEKESIVATSFLTSGGKVFCLTKSKQRLSPQLDKESATSSQVQKTVVKTAVSSDGKEIQVISSKSDPSKRESGTWFGLTGSPPISNELNEFTFGANKESPRSFSQNTSLNLSMPNIASSGQQTKLSPLSSTTSSLQQGSDYVLKDSRRLLNTDSSMVNNKDNRDNLSFQAYLDPKSIKAQYFVMEEKEKSSDKQSSDTSDSEPLMRDDSQSVANKLVRIDSHDSFTMKRRFRHHRRSSSQGERSYPGSLDRRTKSLSISQESVRSCHTTALGVRNGVYVQTPSRHGENNPFHYSSSPDIDSFLHRAKSEEALKQALKESGDALMTEVSPRTKKETLQERAARILGLSSAYTTKAKDKQPNAINTNPHMSDALSIGESSSSLTTVTPTKTAHGNISHSAVETTKFSLGNSNENIPENEPFAVSVTESMLNRSQGQFEIRNLSQTKNSNSSDDVSSISEDSVNSQLSARLSSSLDGEYTIEVSDSVLEDASVPIKVKPHKENVYLTPAKEYKIPENIATNTKHGSSPEKILSPGIGHASIVASYANNIYDRTPRSSTEHSHDYSDDTTETESLLEQSAHYRELLEKSATSKSSVNGSFHSTASDESKSTNAISALTNVTSMTSNQSSRAVSSPVPIATHSAPLTSGELDIIMQLYNSADDTVSTFSKDALDRKATPSSNSPRNVDAKKQKIAQAIGFDVRNIDRGRSTNKLENETRLEKVEDFDIKIFPDNHQKKLTSSSKSQDLGSNKKANSEVQCESSNEEGGVLEVMQSLGLKPEESWLVSL